MRKFLNDPKTFVTEFLEGVALASDGTLKFEPKYNLIYRADMPKPDRVSIIQGSGSGHEPAHTMIVGPGMLDAACPGNVFAAPPMEYPYECTKLMNSKKGVLHLINNYQGDRMVWDMAREMCDRYVSSEDFIEGSRRFIIGLGKKMIIANAIGGTVDRLRKPFRDGLFFVQQDNWALPAIETATAEASHWPPRADKYPAG